MQQSKIPLHLKHQPIIGVEYKSIDEKAGAGDAAFLSIGKSQWNSEDISAKVIRERSDGCISRQSEELPLWRVLDLAKLIISRIKCMPSSLNEFVVSKKDESRLNDFIRENMELYVPRLRELTDLLNSKADIDERQSSTPNIFNFATSELSQDAILCYIFSWADDKFLAKDNLLCNTAKKLLSLFSGIPPTEIKTVCVGKQWRNIDIWVEINNDSILIIEDKTSTSIHDNQLERYKKIVSDEYKGKRDKQSFAYYKTDNEPKRILDQIRELGFSPIKRKDILDVLMGYIYENGRNELVINYAKHLEGVENATQEFRSKNVDEWGWYQWQGFFKELEQKIDVDSWDYVANPNGGFLGLWWHFTEKTQDNVRMYLQFEEKKLCVKIEYIDSDHKDSRSAMRNKYHNLLMKHANECGLDMNRPSRFGAGTYMTIGVIPSDAIFTKDGINMDRMINKLHQYERLVDACVADS